MSYSGCSQLHTKALLTTSYSIKDAKEYICPKKCPKPAGQKDKVPADTDGDWDCNGDRPGARTPDPLIKSQLLCQLS